MSIVKPFKGLRPRKDIAAALSCLPYDVMNTQEAAVMADGNPQSFLHITRAEIDLPVGTDPHSNQVYDQSLANFNKFKQLVLVVDRRPHLLCGARPHQIDRRPPCASLLPS